MKHYNVAAGVLLLAAFFFTSGAAALEFNVNPLRVYFDGKVKSATLVVENKSDEVLTVQASANSWVQEDGKDDLIAPSNDLIVSPPIFKIQPKSKQVVRVGNLIRPDLTKEISYRLYLQEVPPPPKPGDTTMAVAVRFSLPVFILPAGVKLQSEVKWKAAPLDAKNFKLTLSNVGNAHIQITSVSASLPDGSVLASLPAMMIYILPGQSRTITLKTSKPWNKESLRVMIKSDAAPPGVETEVKSE